MKRLPALLAVSVAVLAGCGDNDEATPAGVPATFFGVAPQDPPTSVDLARMANGGVGSYHLLLGWSAVERSPGVYDWSSYDQLLSELASQGIEPVPYLFGTPGHFAEDPVVPPTHDPKTLAAWEDFVAAAAERYGPDGTFWREFTAASPDVEPRPLRLWEIWNEPNTPAFWHPEPSPAAYAKLLSRSERAIHSVDPTAEIMVAGMFATPSAEGAIRSFQFLRDLYGIDDIAEIVDLVGVHPYGPELRDVERQLAMTRAEMRRAGEGDAGMWVTEFGWGSDESSRSPLAVAPERQAALLGQTYELLIEERERWNLQGALWYTWRDPADQVLDCIWCRSAGLFDRDLDPKPAWEEFTRLTGGTP